MLSYLPTALFKFVGETSKAVWLWRVIVIQVRELAIQFRGKLMSNESAVALLVSSHACLDHLPAHVVFLVVRLCYKFIERHPLYMHAPKQTKKTKISIYPTRYSFSNMICSIYLMMSINEVPLQLEFHSCRSRSRGTRAWACTRIAYPTSQIPQGGRAFQKPQNRTNVRLRWNIYEFPRTGLNLIPWCLHSPF